MNAVRWGIVGAGRIAATFAGDMQHVENGEVIAVASRVAEGGRSFAQTHGIRRHYAGYDALFDDPEIDAVYIATPHTLHLEQAMSAMRRGKAILCEKPMTVNAREADAMIASARDADVYLMEAMWTWFLPAIQRARAWVDEGRVGRVQHVKADFGYPLLPFDPDLREYDARLAGGCLLEMGIYPVAIARFFMARDPESITARAVHAPNGVEDDVTMLFDYGDQLATLATSFRCRLPNACAIIGDAGYIMIPDFFRASACTLYKIDQQIDHFQQPHAGNGFEYQLRAVCDDIQAGRRESRVVTHEASRAFQRNMDSVRALFEP